jgi:hypothetical protein
VNTRQPGVTMHVCQMQDMEMRSGSCEARILGKFIYVHKFCHLLQYIIFVLTIDCLIL